MLLPAGLTLFFLWKGDGMRMSRLLCMEIFVGLMLVCRTPETVTNLGKGAEIATDK